jgi:hypothetical protein
MDGPGRTDTAPAALGKLKPRIGTDSDHLNTACTRLLIRGPGECLVAVAVGGISPGLTASRSVSDLERGCQLAVHSVGVAEGQDGDPCLGEVGDLAVLDSAGLEALRRRGQVVTGADHEADVV